MLTAFATCSHLTKGLVGSARAHSPFCLLPAVASLASASGGPILSLCLSVLPSGTQSWGWPAGFMPSPLIPGVASVSLRLPVTVAPTPRLPRGFSGTSLAERRVNAQWTLALLSSEAPRPQGPEHEPPEMP